MRWQSASVQTLLASRVGLIPKIFLWMDFPSTPLLVWNGGITLPLTPVGETGTWNWEPGWDLLSTSEVTHALEPGSTKLQVRVNSVSQEMLALARGNLFGQEMKLWRGWGTVNGDAIVGGEIVLAWQGLMDSVVINRDAITIDGEQRIILMSGVDPVLRTDGDFKGRHSGDKFFNIVASLTDNPAKGLNANYRPPLD